jgi:hypothetical protein
VCLYQSHVGTHTKIRWTVRKISRIFLQCARCADVIVRQIVANKCVCAVQKWYGEAVSQGLDPRGDSHHKTIII